MSRRTKKDVWGVSLKQTFRELFRPSRTAQADLVGRCTITGGPAGEGPVVCSCVGCTVWRSRELSAMPVEQLVAVLRDERNEKVQ